MAGAVDQTGARCVPQVPKGGMTMANKIFSYACPQCGFRVDVNYVYAPVCPICGGPLVRPNNPLVGAGVARTNKKQNQERKKR